MKQFLLATALILLPVGLFSAFQIYTQQASATASAAPLGDLSAMKAVVADTQAIAEKGDLVAAQKRITDFETLWDAGQPKLQPLDEAAWGNVDDASDAALKSLRAKPADAAKVTAKLAGLIAALDNPAGADSAVSSGVKLISGIAVTDPSGHNIPCEVMIKALQAAVSGGKIKPANSSAVLDFQTKATERCNADDDVHADALSAQGLALAAN